jgi:hypothetical protein
LKDLLTQLPAQTDNVRADRFGRQAGMAPAFVDALQPGALDTMRNGSQERSCFTKYARNNIHVEIR